jgi:hypothetical protein
MKKVIVDTLITQLIEVPDDATEQDLKNFLANNQSFNDAFAGVTDGEFKIVNIVPESDDVAVWGVEG